MNKIKIESIQPQLVAGMRYRGSYDNIMDVLPTLLGYLTSQGVELSGPPIFINHEPTPEDSLIEEAKGNADIEICAPVSQKIKDNDLIKCYTLPGGRMAKSVHEGPYSELGLLRQRIIRWAKRNRRMLTAPLREYILNDPLRVPEKEILTEVYAPIN